MGCSESIDVGDEQPERQAKVMRDLVHGSSGTTEGKAGARPRGLGGPRAPAVVVPEPATFLQVAVPRAALRQPGGSKEEPSQPGGCAAGGETGPASVYPEGRRRALAEGPAWHPCGRQRWKEARAGRLPEGAKAQKPRGITALCVCCFSF